MSKIPFVQLTPRDTFSISQSANYDPITITSIALKKGKTYRGHFLAHRYEESGELYFILSQTNRDLLRMRFELEPDCIIDDGSNKYRCEEIKYLYPSPHNVVIKVVKEPAVISA